MKPRFVAAAALAGALLASVSGAQAAPPVMDGKKLKVLNVKAVGGLQDNTKDDANLDGPEAVDCKPPRCSRFPFVYKPARGVKGGLMFSLTWTNPAADFDLYVAEANKGRNTEIASCGFFGTTSAKTYVPPAALKSGRTYVMVVGHFRSINDTAQGKIQINVPDSRKTTVPARAELLPLNCQL